MRYNMDVTISFYFSFNSHTFLRELNTAFGESKFPGLRPFFQSQFLKFLKIDPKKSYRRSLRYAITHKMIDDISIGCFFCNTFTLVLEKHSGFQNARKNLELSLRTRLLTNFFFGIFLDSVYC